MTPDLAEKTAENVSSRSRVELVLQQLDQLPTLPSVAARLIALASSEVSSVADVAAVIETDPSLAARVLSMLRRADLGVDTTNLTVARAVNLLGFRAIRNIALSAQVFELIPSSIDDSSTAKRREELWKHCLAVACAAEMLAEANGDIILQGYAFLGGLLHDIGKIALDAIAPKSYARAVEQTEHHVCICDAEQDVFGLSHTTAGKHLMSAWQLPRPIVECVWLHHQAPESLPSAAGHRRLIHLIHAADCLVRRQHIGFSGYVDSQDAYALAEALGVRRQRFDAIIGELPQRMEPFCQLIGLDHADARSLYMESLVAANRELSRLNLVIAENSRKLSTRVRCFDAQHSFSINLGDDAHVADVCAEAGRVMSTMLGLRDVLTFIGLPDSNCLFISRANGDPNSSRTDIVDLAEHTSTGALDGLVPIPSAVGTIQPASGSAIALWRSFASAPANQPVWTFPFLSGRDPVGVALFPAGLDELAKLEPNDSGWSALAATFAAATKAARTRQTLEATTDELLEINRRLQVAQKDLTRSRSVAMVAEMAAGAAHELNNPLAVISGRAQLLLKEGLPEESAKALKSIVEQCQNATGIVNELIRFAKPEPPTPVLFRVSELLDMQCQHWHARFVPEQLRRIDIGLNDKQLSAYADPEQFVEIVLATLENALQASQQTGTDVQVNSPSCSSDETVRIVVEDQGIGMTPEVLEHAIDPFFSHRSAGRGRGLGLSRAYRLAKINGGGLWLESTPGIGTRATLELPARAPHSL